MSHRSRTLEEASAAFEALPDSIKVRKIIKSIVEEDGRSSYNYWAGLVILAPMFCGFKVEDIVNFLSPTPTSNVANKIRLLYDAAVKVGVLLPEEEAWAGDWPGVVDKPEEFAISLMLDILVVTGFLVRFRKDDGWYYNVKKEESHTSPESLGSPLPSQP